MSIVIAHCPKHSKGKKHIRESYALYVDGALTATWDGEVQGFDVKYIENQARKWCRPNQDFSHAEMKCDSWPDKADFSPPAVAEVPSED